MAEEILVGQNCPPQVAGPAVELTQCTSAVVHCSGTGDVASTLQKEKQEKTQNKMRPWISMVVASAKVAAVDHISRREKVVFAASLTF